MRVAASRAIRVGPGDEVVIRGSLPATSDLGRLYVFASAEGGEFAPYARHAGQTTVVDGRPMMLTPLSMRLVRAQPTRKLTFVSDIDGFIRVMQEVDTPNDPKAHIRIERKINPALGWKDWIIRCLKLVQRPTSSWR